MGLVGGLGGGREWGPGRRSGLDKAASPFGWAAPRLVWPADFAGTLLPDKYEAIGRSGLFRSPSGGRGDSITAPNIASAPPDTQARKSAPVLAARRPVADTAAMLHHRREFVINFSDADPAGLLFYPRALALAHDTVEAMITQSSLGRDAWFASSTHLYPLRRAEADFLGPLRPGDPVTAAACVEKLGDTSVTFLVEFVGPSGQTAARIRTVHVLVDRATGQPAPWPDHLKRALQG
jgi:acyl-CoA thioesterase FadM